MYISLRVKCIYMGSLAFWLPPPFTPGPLKFFWHYLTPKFFLAYLGTCLGHVCTKFRCVRSDIFRAVAGWIQKPRFCAPPKNGGFGGLYKKLLFLILFFCASKLLHMGASYASKFGNICATRLRATSSAHIKRPWRDNPYGVPSRTFDMTFLKCYCESSTVPMWC